MAFEFVPSPTVRPEVIGTGENNPGTGNRQFADKKKRGHIDFMALMCSRPKPRKKTSTRKPSPLAPSGVNSHSPEKVIISF